MSYGRVPLPDRLRAVLLPGAGILLKYTDAGGFSLPFCVFLRNNHIFWQIYFS